MIGDGSTSGVCTSTIYGSADDRSEIMPRHQDLIERINDGAPAQGERAGQRHRAVAAQPPVVQALPRIARRCIGHRRAQACPVVDRAGSTRGGGLVPPWSVRRRWLRRQPGQQGIGLRRARLDFDRVCCEAPSGCCRRSASRLGSTTCIGVAGFRSGTPARTGWNGRTNAGRASTCVSPLAASSGSPARSDSRCLGKQALLGSLVAERTKGFYDVDTTVRLIERSDEGIELTYNLSEPRNHSYVVNGIVVRNCSEYLHSTTARAISPRSTCCSTSTTTARSTSVRSRTPSTSSSPRRRSWSGAPTTRPSRSPTRLARSGRSGSDSPTSARC